MQTSSGGPASFCYSVRGRAPAPAAHFGLPLATPWLQAHTRCCYTAPVTLSGSWHLRAGCIGALRPIAAPQLVAVAHKRPHGCPPHNVAAGTAGTRCAAAAGRRRAPELAPAGRGPVVCHAAQPRLSRRAAPLLESAALCSPALACCSGAASAPCSGALCDRKHWARPVFCLLLTGLLGCGYSPLPLSDWPWLVQGRAAAGVCKTTSLQLRRRPPASPSLWGPLWGLRPAAPQRRTTPRCRPCRYAQPLVPGSKQAKLLGACCCALPRSSVSSWLRQGLSPQQHGEALKPGFHITAPTGWMNDPNGLFQSQQGIFHVFYQVTWRHGLHCWTRLGFPATLPGWARRGAG